MGNDKRNPIWERVRFQMPGQRDLNDSEDIPLVSSSLSFCLMHKSIKHLRLTNVAL